MREVCFGFEEIKSGYNGSKSSLGVTLVVWIGTHFPFLEMPHQWLFVDWELPPERAAVKTPQVLSSVESFPP